MRAVEHPQWQQQREIQAERNPEKGLWGTGRIWDQSKAQQDGLRFIWPKRCPGSWNQQYIFLHQGTTVCQPLRYGEEYNLLENRNNWFQRISGDIHWICAIWLGQNHRYVITREKKADKQGDLFTGDDFTYRAIMTNNRDMTDLEVIEFYNDRDEGERLFDEMNNDFLWEKMPFSFLHENTVFLAMMAICRNLYHFLTDFISKKLDFIKPTFRLKKFIFRFMVVPSKWITRGRQQILKLFSAKKYHLLLR